MALANPVCNAAVVDMHRGQLSVPPATVRRLIGEQFPQWKHLPVRPTFMITAPPERAPLGNQVS
jgi:hypothetical protein